MNSKPDPHVEPTASSNRPKNSFFKRFGAGSLTISLGLHFLLLAAGVVWVFKIIPEPENEIVWTTSSDKGSRSSEAMESRQRVQMSRSNMPKVVAIGRSTGITLPEPEEMAQMTALASLGKGGSLGGLGASGKFGKNGLHGDGVWDGGDQTKRFLPMPEVMGKRCSGEDRLARLKENGGNEACEDAVLKSLRWLKANQNSDGSWGRDTPAAMTGLVLLAYFGHCETPDSDEFGESCMRGIVYLVNLGMRNDGRMAGNFTANHWSYEHAIATYALGEATTFCKPAKIEIPNLTEVTTKAGQFIIDHQNENGGWAYLYATEGGHTDVSVAGWQIQALRACSHTDIRFKGMKPCIGKALDYVNNCQNPNGGFGYTGKNSSESGYFTLTGVGMLCNQMWEKGNRTEVRKGARYVLENTRFDYNTGFCDLYGHYYESQAMMQRGGDEWKQYNNLFRDQILQNQDTDGSWKTPGGGKKPRATGARWQQDKLYRTSLCTLMLEVYYRYLNTGGATGKRPGI